MKPAWCLTHTPVTTALIPTKCHMIRACNGHMTVHPYPGTSPSPELEQRIYQWHLGLLTSPTITQTPRVNLPTPLRTWTIQKYFVKQLLFFFLTQKYETKKELSPKCLVFQFLKFTFSSGSSDKKDVFVIATEYGLFHGRNVICFVLFGVTGLRAYSWFCSALSSWGSSKAHRGWGDLDPDWLCARQMFNPRY